MSIALMNRVAELERRVEAIEAENRRLTQLTEEEPSTWGFKRKPGRPKKHEVPQAQEGKA